MKKVAIYARVSTKRQEEEETIESQIGAVMERLRADGFSSDDAIQYVDRDYSGSVLERPGLDRLREDAKLKKFVRVYVFDYGRLSRDLTDLMLVKDEVESSGIQVISLFERITGDEAVDRLMLQIMGAVYEYERKKTAQRFLNGKKQKANRGHVVGYNAPYGHDYVPIKRVANKKVAEGFFVINKEEAKIATMICEWIGLEGMTTKGVQRKLYELKIPPRKGRRLQWSTSQIGRVATNESLIGKHYYFKTESCLPKNPKPKSQEDKYKVKHTKKTSRRKRDKSEWIMVRVPRIITDDLFHKVKAQLEQNRKLSPRSKKRQYLFGGIVRCTCGAARTGEGGERNAYYRCINRHRTFPEPPTCNQAGINVSVFDTACWQEIVSLLTQPEQLENQLNRYVHDKVARIEAESTKQQTQKSLKALANEEKRYAKALGSGLMSPSIYEDQMRDLMRRRKELEAEASKPSDELIDKLKSLDLNTVAASFNKLLEDMLYEDKLFTVRKIVDKVIATKEQVTICGQIPSTGQLTDTQVGLNVEHRHRRPAERRQVDALQHADRQQHSGG